MSDGLEDNAMGAMDNKKFKIYPQAEPNGQIQFKIEQECIVRFLNMNIKLSKIKPKQERPLLKPTTTDGEPKKN